MFSILLYESDQFVHNAVMSCCTMVAVLAITLVALLGCSLASPRTSECIARGENRYSYNTAHSIIPSVLVADSYGLMFAQLHVFSLP